MSSLLLFGDSERSAALRHEVPLAIIDPFLFAEVDGRRVIMTSLLERDRIAAVLPDAELLDMFELGLRDLITQNGMPREDAVREVTARAVAQIGVREAVVPGDFPLGVADRLRADGVTLTVDDSVFEARRRAKTGRELEGVRAAQRAAEAGMAAAAALLARAEPGSDGRLHLDGAELHAEHVRAALRAACAEHAAPCPPDVIVASVWNGTGHEPGSGPLPAGLPIQIDLWPRHEETACWADMTRTFVVGEPTSEHAELIAAQEELVRAALEDARARARPGVTGRELYDAACDRFEAAGHRTQRTGPDPEDRAEGFQFSLGHGVGLEVHEEPGLGLAGREELVPGDVLAVEPGLWDRRIGGVRYEDLLLVTDDGCETLTRYPYDLTPG
jgi:Xaa-Pro aminopeptidase